MGDELSPEELSKVDRFRQARKTSVLTILFTDIEGFTRFTEQRGDQASDNLRREHDRIVVSTLEEGGAGQVIKRIGDAVMAVFAEPSAAVDRTLRVQERLAQWNREHPDEPLSVRIGLHMGQVTVEDQVSPDVFGRHVNRASRIEGLAGGGQVYLSYPVFDSAKSWLLANADKARWAMHGRYRVKGIEEPLELYEVFDPRRDSPRPPAGAARVSSFPKPLAAAALAALGALAAFAATRYNRKSVSFEDLGVSADIVADHAERLIFEGRPGDHLRRLKTKLGSGRHILHYDVSHVTRYYAEVEVKRGENILRPRWEYFGLPGLERNVAHAPGGEKLHEFAETVAYSVYAADGTRKERKAELSLRIGSEAESPARARWTVAWKVVLDGRVAVDRTERLIHSGKSDSSETVTTIGWEDERHYWSLHSYVSPLSIQSGITSSYIEYK